MSVEPEMGKRIAADVKASAEIKFQISEEVMPMAQKPKTATKLMTITETLVLGILISITSAVPLCSFDINIGDNPYGKISIL